MILCLLSCVLLSCLYAYDDDDDDDDDDDEIDGTFVIVEFDLLVMYLLQDLQATLAASAAAGILIITCWQNLELIIEQRRQSRAT